MRNARGRGPLLRHSKKPGFARLLRLVRSSPSFCSLSAFRSSLLVPLQPALPVLLITQRREERTGEKDRARALLRRKEGRKEGIWWGKGGRVKSHDRSITLMRILPESGEKLSEVSSQRPPKGATPRKKKQNDGRSALIATREYL